MNVRTVKENLERTLQGKMVLLKVYNEYYEQSTMAESTALAAVINFLKLNITELDAILDDVKQIIQQEK